MDIRCLVLCLDQIDLSVIKQEYHINNIIYNDNNIFIKM